MPSNGPLNTPYEQPGCATPSPGDSTVAAHTGGYDMNQGDGKQGLVSSPFMGQSPFTAAPGQSETPNMGELPPQIQTMGPFQGSPGMGEHVGVADGVASPSTPATTLGQK
jgi:hypothetical protein